MGMRTALVCGACVLLIVAEAEARLCSLASTSDNCKALREECVRKYDNLPAGDRAICETAGYTPALHANDQLRAARGFCSSSGGNDGDCDRQRRACRENTVSCGMVQRAACRDGETGAMCDPRYLCSPDGIELFCSMHNALGASFVHSQLKYTYMDAELGSHIVSVGGTGAGMLDLYNMGGMGVAYAVDADLGWFVEEDGFAYLLDFHLGLGFKAGQVGMIGATVGVGLNGIYDGYLPNAYTVSTRGFATARLAAGLELLAFVNPTWTYGAESRVGGSDLASPVGADELTGGLFITKIGKRSAEGAYSLASGYSLGVYYHELLDTRFVGVGIGIGRSEMSAH